MKTSIVRRTKIQLKNYPIEPQKESIGLTTRKECLENIDKGIALYKILKK